MAVPGVTETAAVGQLIAGRYRILSRLADGGMSQVWLATDQRLRRQVAIKKCALPDGLTAAEQHLVGTWTLRDARVVARIDHPHVIRVLDVLPDTGEPWIVMEYVPSRSLLQVIEEDGALPPPRVAAIGLAVLSALAAAGRAGVLHLDVKPANVLIADDGRIVLSDFGPAVTREGIDALTNAGIVLGSPKYIAPERLVDRVSTAQADLWSLGATLYHAVEGRPPYVRESTAATLAALAGGGPDPARRAGPLGGVLRSLLQRDPAARPAAAAVELELRRAMRHATPARPTVRRRAAAVAAGVAAVAAIAAVAAGAQRDDPVAARPAAAAPILPVSPSPTPLVLPSRFAWWNDPSGFRVAVPAGWRHRGDSRSGHLFSAAAGGPSLRISTWVQPPGNIVGALVGEERDIRLAGYRRIKIETLPAPAEAMWEYTFQDPDGVAMHGVRRVVDIDGRTYIIEWQASKAAWTAELQRLAVILESFGPRLGD